MTRFTSELIFTSLIAGVKEKASGARSLQNKLQFALFIILLFHLVFIHNRESPDVAFWTEVMAALQLSQEAHNGGNEQNELAFIQEAGGVED